MNDWRASLIRGSVTYPLPVAASINPYRPTTDTEDRIVHTLVEMAAERPPEERADAVIRYLDSAGYVIVRRV